MKSRLSLSFAALTLFATAAFAADFGVHAGYYTDDVNKATGASAKRMSAPMN